VVRTTRYIALPFLAPLGSRSAANNQSTYPIPSPPLWSISVSPTHKYICLATSSPSLHFLTIPSGSGAGLEPPPPHLLRSDTLPSRTRTVSLAWGIPKIVKTEDEGWEWRDTYIITGNSDSSFRKWELPLPTDGSGGRGQGRVLLKSRAVVEKIGKIKGKRVPNKGTIVWGVGVLP
jgi:U3 small nucleolar RNA-associated protein 4